MALYSKVAIDNAISKATKELGYNELCPNQLAAITSFVNGRDVFVCLPSEAESPFVTAYFPPCSISSKR